MNKISFDGFGARRRKRRSHKRSGGRSGQKSRFRAAAKACKGKSLRAFRACMKQHLKK